MKTNKLLLSLFLASSLVASQKPYDLHNLHIRFEMDMADKERIMFFGPELYAGDQKIVCTRCGAHPVMVMLVKGKLEALCLDHAPRRSARGIDIDKRMVF